MKYQAVFLREPHEALAAEYESRTVAAAVVAALCLLPVAGLPLVSVRQRDECQDQPRWRIVYGSEPAHGMLLTVCKSVSHLLTAAGLLGTL